MRIPFFSLFCIVFLIFFTSCKVTKFVPEGEYLLDKVEIKTEKQEVKKEDLERYVRQMPNSSVFGIWRMQLRIYSTAGRDTTKWINRVLMNAGEAPVIYNPSQTYLSEQSLKKAMENKGFMHTEVSSTAVFDDKKKARITYFIKENEPYRLNDYTIELPDDDLVQIAGDSVNSLIKKDMLFDVDVFNAERERISRSFREQGHYRFNKELLTYLADSSLSSNRVDVSIKLRDLDEGKADSIRSIIFNKYTIRNIVFLSSRGVSMVGSRVSSNAEDYEVTQEGNYILVNDKEKFLKMKTLVENTFIEPGNLYSDAAVEKTYTALNSLPPVKYVNINFREVRKDSLDCLITVSPTKLLSLTTELEATYTDGYWGVAAGLGTVHRNVFKGAESLSLQGRLAYEWQGNVLARELGAQAGLLFPNFLMPFIPTDFRRRIRANTEFTANINYQNRPGEFEVTNVGTGMKYGWSGARVKHTFELLDLSFVDFTVTDEFWNTFIATGKFNKYNYEDHLITRIGYIGSFSTYNPNRPLKNHVSMRYSIETAGNLLYGINKLFGGKKNKEGSYTILNDIPYSQYIKADYNITYHQIVDAGNRFVYHFGLGAGTPYGNAGMIPYERRYFSGGANSVRGWAESTLGPGIYSRASGFSARRRDYNQVGDIKLDLNAEYRYKMFGVLDGALFIDGGNIWTVKPYSTQPGGEFRFNTFLNQIAFSYGTGLRLDFSFVVVRLDLGIRLYNPSLPRSSRWRTSLTSDDFALHFAIGYPF